MESKATILKKILNQTDETVHPSHTMFVRFMSNENIIFHLYERVGLKLQNPYDETYSNNFVKVVKQIVKRHLIASFLDQANCFLLEFHVQIVICS